MENDAANTESMNPKATGVYMIRCHANNKVYIGSTAISFIKRWAYHRKHLRSNRHANRHLQFAWEKYGTDAFEFIVLEECPPDSCLAREQVWINSTQAANDKFGFNLSPTAGSPLGVKHTPETRAKVSAAMRKREFKDEWRKAVSEGLRGKKRKAFSEEWRKKLSASKKGKPKSPEHVRKTVETKRNKRLARELLRQQDQLGLQFGSDDCDA